MAEVTTPRELPSPEELDLANYLVGTYLSEISNFAERLEWIKGDPMTIEEYLARQEAGDTFEPRVPLDRDQLAHIIAFATDALSDADAMREYVEKLQEAAFALYRDDSRPDEVRNHYRRLREWHLGARVAMGARRG
jgi:hypothetical protein